MSGWPKSRLAVERGGVAVMTAGGEGLTGCGVMVVEAGVALRGVPWRGVPWRGVDLRLLLDGDGCASSVHVGVSVVGAAAQLSPTSPQAADMMRVEAIR